MAEQHQPATSGPSLATISRCSSVSDRSDGSHRACNDNENTGLIPVDAVALHVSCGLCNGPVASSLLLSCSHLFCGDCISKHLLQSPSCPTCNMDLRAVPIRCLAMDKVAASVVPSLTTEQQQQYARRKEDGQCAADKVNKMFWYLAPSALPSAVGVAGLPLPGAAAPLLPASVELPGGALPLDHKTPGSLQGCAGAIHSHPQQQYTSAMPYGMRAAPGAAVAASSGPLLQLAVAAQQMAHAQQVAQMQQLAHVQQQISNLQLNPACRHMVPGFMGGQDPSAVMGLAAQAPVMSGMQGYHNLQQLSSMMGSMCQV